MRIGGKAFRTIWPGSDAASVQIIDQTRLPHEFEIISIKTATEAARAPESVRVIRNLVILGKTLGEIDPDLFDGFALALPEAMQQAKAQGKEPPGFLSILNKFRSKDLRRGLVAVNSLLEAWGKDFFSEAHSKPGK